MIDLDKFTKAMQTLKSDAQWSLIDDTNPHSEITYLKTKTEMDKL